MVARYVITEHARQEMKRRGLSEATVNAVLHSPQQEMYARAGRIVLQSKVAMEAGKEFLVRVFVDIDRDPAEVVTAYRTSKIEKYWRTTRES